MKYQIWKWCGIMILSWCLSPLFAQSEIESQTLALFDSPVTWMNQYMGLIDGEHSASLSLAFDGFNCRGFMNIGSSDTQYLLEGSLEANRLVLLEKYQGTPSGYIEGDLKDGDISLVWTSMDEQQAYQAEFEKTTDQTNKLVSKIAIMEGTLDEQAVQLILHKYPSHTVGSLIFANGSPTEKLYSEYGSSEVMQFQNISSGYVISLVNTKEDQFVSSFILPGTSKASQMDLILKTEIDIEVKNYLSHRAKSSIALPRINASFEAHMKEMTIDWVNDISAHQDLKSKKRFANTSKIWFELKDYTEQYVSGILHFSNSWDNKVVSRSFTYDRAQDNMVKVAPFMKGSAKWENVIKQKMIAAKKMNSESDQEHYEHWINKATLIDPILCEGGLKFYTETNSVFGQAKTFVPWNLLTPQMISTSKLNKLRKVK